MSDEDLFPFPTQEEVDKRHIFRHQNCKEFRYTVWLNVNGKSVTINCQDCGASFTYTFDFDVRSRFVPTNSTWEETTKIVEKYIPLIRGMKRISAFEPLND